MPPALSASLVHLRAINSTLTSTPEASLPTAIPTIAQQLYSSPILDDALSLAQEKEDALVLCNKFKGRVSALLQSRVPQARWAGVVLVKVSVESSGAALEGWAAGWIRSLVGLVSRPEPPSTAVMLIRTLSRVFTVLTNERPTLTRELVTPHLPAFFTAILAATGAELQIKTAAWEALGDVVAAHPVTFRPFLNKARPAVLKAMGTEVESYARELWVGISACASGKGSGSSGGKAGAVAAEWRALFEAVVSELHIALDVALQPVTEDYDYRHSTSRSNASETGLPPAEEGVAPQIERALLLLRILGTFYTTPTAAQPAIPISQLIDVVSRIFAISAASATPNSAIERSVRETLFSLLPTLHKATLKLLDTVSRRLQSALLPFVPAILEQAAHVVSETPKSADVKIAAYTLTSTLLTLSGPALGKATVLTLHPTISTACDDLLPCPPSAPRPLTGKNKKPTATTTHADNLLSSAPTNSVFTPPGLQDAAGKLLATALAKLPALHTRTELRVKMERTAVLTGNKDALLAAVLFPRPATMCRGVGLVPHLVAAGVGLETEGLIRPRLPVVWTGITREEIRRQREEAQAEAEAESEAEEEEEEQVERRASKRPRTSSSPPPPAPLPQPAMARVFARQPSFAAPSTGGEEGISPEKPYPALPILATAAAPVAAKSAFGGGIEYPALSRAAATVTAGVSPVKLGAATVVEREEEVLVTDKKVIHQERKQVPLTIEEDSDEEMEIPEIDMGGSDDDEDEE
ncbi:rRNA processing/ribosome biogenesis-domain-containing protein [Sphaerosporella brunnea]|uniref:Pre-rRNA-processing protein RIX1 n=1 Tax=Sphaerosporella brunnea TaxID=1250544 RepID=A0A5J5EWM2_9PEZI|nr:rRNA processing/ribosome biogenesis-domain-containing protein [Sphaerosporella brunnea]